MKSINNYILLVDGFVGSSKQGNTSGRYRVAAKTKEEAVKLLRNKIKFGKIYVYYMCNPEQDNGEWLKYKEVKQEIPYYEKGKFIKFVHVEPYSAIAKKM